MMLAAFAVPAFAQTYQVQVYSQGIKPTLAANFVMTGNPATSQTLPGTVVGYSSTPISFGIQNTGNLSGTMAVPALTAIVGSDFQLGTNCSSTAAKGACALTAVFRPTAVGSRSSSFSLGGATYVLSGLGIAATPNFVLNPAAAANQTFPSTVVGATSAAIGFNYQNTGTAAGAMVPSLSGLNTADFRVTDTCSLVAPNGNCQVTAAFLPKSSGSRAATLTMNGSTYSLSGTGIAAVPIFVENPALSTTQSFGTVAVNSAATPVVFNFINNGYASGTLTPVVSGANAADFTTANTCSSVAIGATCKVTVTFTAKADGARAASLAMNGMTYALSGTGAGAANFVISNTAGNSFTSSALVGSSAASVDLTFTNSGTKAGSMTVPAMAGPNTADFAATNTCSNVAINATCTVSVVFTPTASGARSATLALLGITYTYNGTGQLPVTWDPAFKGGAYTLSNSNLSVTTLNSVLGNVRATVGKSSGKWYWETTMTSGSVNGAYGGITLSTLPLGASCIGCGSNASGAGVDYSIGSVGTNRRAMAGVNSTIDASGTTIGSYGTKVGDVWGYAVDLDNHTMLVYYKAFDSSTCLNHPVVSWTNIPVATWYPLVSTQGGNFTVTTNFGATAFSCKPAGYSTLN